MKMSERVGLIKPNLPVIEWNTRKVCNWMAEVRSVGGIPIFKTKYGGVPFEKNGEKCVLGVGWDTKGKATSVWICGIPENLYNELAEKPADFLTLYKMCPTDIKKKMENAPPPQ